MCVSIPFKRESLSEQYLFYSKGARTRVSIPFKRESVSEPRKFRGQGD